MAFLYFIVGILCVCCGVQSFSVPSKYVSRNPFSMKHETIVVTGLGVVSPVGSNADIFFDNLLKGVSGVGPVSRFDASPFKCQIAAQINDFDPKTYYKSKKKIKQNDLYTHYAVAASHLALADAGMTLGDGFVDPTRVGCIIGSAFGGMDSFERAANDLTKYGPTAVGPYTIPMILGNTAAGIVGMETGAKGPNFGVQTACATATHALGEVCPAIFNQPKKQRMCTA